MTDEEKIYKIKNNTIYQKLKWYIYKKTSSTIYYISFLEISDHKRLNISFNYYIPTNNCFISISLINKGESIKVFRSFSKGSLLNLYNTIRSSYPTTLPERLKHKAEINSQHRRISYI